MIVLDIQRSQAAWGEVSLDNSGAHDYDVNLLNRTGSTIYAHADSVAYVQTDKDYLVSGALNNDGRPQSPCQFFIDGVEIGTLDDPRYETASRTIFGQKSTKDGWHKLEIKAKRNGMAHTLWRFREAEKAPVDQKVAICACVVSDHDNVNRFLGMATPNGFTASRNLFIDQAKNKLDVPTRIAALIQNAIDSGAEVIVLSEVNTLIEEDFYTAAKQVYPGNGLVYYAQEIEEAKVVNNDYALDPTAPKHISAIALAALDWVRINKIPNEEVGVRALIRLIAEAYTKEYGTLVRLDTGIFPVHVNPYVVMTEPEPIRFAPDPSKQVKKKG